MQKHSKILSNNKVAPQEPFTKIDAYALQKYCDISPNQKIYWRDYSPPERNWCNIWDIIHMGKAVDLEALEKAFKVLIERHEVLRTTFHCVDERWVQCINKRMNYTVRPSDIVKIKADNTELNNRETRMSLFFSASLPHLRRSFDLQKGPMFRHKLLKSDLGYKLLLVGHHLILDGLSSILLGFELLSVYNSVIHSEPIALEPVKMQYSEYSEFQNNWLASSRSYEHRSFWKKKLQGCDVADYLPKSTISRNRNIRRGFYYRIRLDDSTLNDIKNISMKYGTSLFLFSMTIMYLLLHQLSGKKDIVLGTPLGGRDNPETKDVVGLLMNTVLLRQHIESETFLGLLLSVKNELKAAKEHQDYQIDQILDDIGLSKDKTTFYLSQTFMSSLKSFGYPDNRKALHGDLGTDVRFELFCYLMKGKQMTALEFRYPRSRFSQHEIERFAHRYIELFDKYSKNPELRIP